jgi:hypothetical protein
MKPAQDEKELYKWLESDAGCTQNPFSFLDSLVFHCPKGNLVHESTTRGGDILNLKKRQY